MYSPETISAQIPIPAPLYDAIAQRASIGGHSITQEILSLLTASLQMDELRSEITDWEAASDDDWLNLETNLTREAPYMARGDIAGRVASPWSTPVGDRGD